MYYHMGLFVLQEHAEGRSKAENLQQILSNIQYMKENIKQIKTITAGPYQPVDGVDFPAADLAVLVVFETEEDYKGYMSHPFHIQAAQFVVKVSVPSKVAGITYRDVLS
ncbi:MAG: hypothetical protein HC837_07150 [Chloroflexaceae bacterium]|nr:hypothetical protein [Chloroflexaceae bacterium]